MAAGPAVVEVAAAIDGSWRKRRAAEEEVEESVGESYGQAAAVW